LIVGAKRPRDISKSYQSSFEPLGVA